MDQVFFRDLADLTLPIAAGAAATATAGGAGDNTARTGLQIDRNAYGVALGAMIVVGYTATLAAAATLTVKSCRIEDSADGTNWASYLSFADPGVVSTGGTGGTTNNGAVVLQADLGAARRYVRFDYTPDLSAAGTDTLRDQAIAILHGLGRLPTH
jgi:hypothetical protein